MQRLTVRVFDAVLAIVDELAAQSFPTVNGVPCEVHLGQPLSPPARFVSVVTRPQSHAVEWRAMPAARTESFTVRVVVQTEAAWTDARSAWLDARDLCVVVERTFRGSDGLPTSFLRAALDVDVFVDTSAVSGMDARVYPTENGWGGQVFVDIPLTCRI